eukprot:6193619-Pleurochrysis_carterae.AAC.2
MPRARVCPCGAHVAVPRARLAPSDPSLRVRSCVGTADVSLLMPARHIARTFSTTHLFREALRTLAALRNA